VKRRSLDDIVRDTIASSGLTRYEISKRSGVPESALSRFMSGERSMTLATLDKLLDVIGIELRKKSR
jgi:transcriptional regulator with XRE-family HTH domain